MAQFNNLSQRAAIDLKSEITRAYGDGFKNVGQLLTQLADQYHDLAKNKAGLAEVNQRLAESMRTAVLTAYSSNVLAKQMVPSYRVGDPKRFAKRLLIALKSPTMAVGTARGIGFIDQGLLDSTAAHWYRLNFGAEPAVESLPAPRPVVRFGAGASVPMGFSDPPSGPFSVPGGDARFGWFVSLQTRDPKGRFTSNLSKGQAFYPGLPYNRKDQRFFVIKKTVSTRGIGAHRFLDAGLVAFAENFKPYYQTYLEDIARRSASKLGNARITGQA